MIGWPETPNISLLNMDELCFEMMCLQVRFVSNVQLLKAPGLPSSYTLTLIYISNMYEICVLNNRASLLKLDCVYVLKPKSVLKLFQNWFSPRSARKLIFLKNSVFLRLSPLGIPVLKTTFCLPLSARLYFSQKKHNCISALP